MKWRQDEDMENNKMINIQMDFCTLEIALIGCIHIRI